VIQICAIIMYLVLGAYFAHNFNETLTYDRTFTPTKRFGAVVLMFFFWIVLIGIALLLTAFERIRDWRNSP